MAATNTNVIYTKAAMLAQDAQGANPDGAVDALLSAAGDDRAALVEARNRFARTLHRHPDDWEATAALTLLNRALSAMGTQDPFDWRERWSRHRKP